MNKWVNTKKIWTGCMPVIHVIVSLIWEALNKPSAQGYPFEMMKVAPGEHISFFMEQFIFCVLSKIAGICMIFVLWNLAYHMFSKKKIHIMLLLLVGTIVIVLLYPNNYLLETDNLMLYANSVLYYPDYWQSIYIGIWYNACLMVFRDSLILPLIQTWLFIGGICYLADECKKHWGKAAGLVPYVLLILPETITVCANPYRNAVYVVLGIWYYAMLYFSVLDKKQQTGKKLILWSLFTAFFGLMRSEGVLALLLFVVTCVWIWQCTNKQKMYGIISLLVFVIILALPQKLGEQKYYGKDYQIVNYMEALRVILGNPERNISYAGAEEDLAIIDDFVPLDVLHNSGLAGFRIYNYGVLGTVNQTLRTPEEQTEFLDAASEIIKNNPGIYLNYRLKNFIIANGGSSGEEVQTIVDKQGFDALQEMLEQGHTYGVTVILEKQWEKEWLVNETHMKIYSQVYDIQDTCYALLWHFRVIWMLRLFALIMLPVLATSLLLKEKNKESIFGVVAALTLLAQWGGIALFSPEARRVYYYPVFFFSLIINWLLIQRIREKESGKKKVA